MHSAAMNSGIKGQSNVPDVKPRIGSTKLAAMAIRDALILAALVALLLMAAQPVQGQETVLYDFAGGSDGANPLSRLTSDGAGNFYGMTQLGGLGYGTVFELSPNGSGGWNETVLYRFCSVLNCTDGAYPKYADLIFDNVGNLYGTTEDGGANEYGVVFELIPVGTNWTETVLYSFWPTDGDGPENGLVMDSAGNLYGTTHWGGYWEDGTVFELSRSGGGWTEQVIYAVDNNDYGLTGLTMDAAGNIFGATYSWVFELSPNGDGGWNPTVLHTFTGAPKDGSGAEGTPVLDKAGNLYGTTTFGGADGCGVVYKLSPGKKGKWTKKILHSFKSDKDGCVPWAGVVLDAAGNVYGTTVGGGKYAGGLGTVFELAAPVGTGTYYKEKILWTFPFGGGWGSSPYDSLILDSAGNLYGTTAGGGSTDNGVVFEVTP